LPVFIDKYIRTLERALISSSVLINICMKYYEHTKLSTRIEMRLEVIIIDVISTIWVLSFGIQMDFKTKKAEQSNNF
jgi:hypothetical protein